MCKCVNETSMWVFRFFYMPLVPLDAPIYYLFTVLVMSDWVHWYSRYDLYIDVSQIFPFATPVK